MILEGYPYHFTGASMTWEHSDIREYLNSTFYNSFSTAERGRIAETQNTNAANPWFDTAGGNTTADLVFLLSLDDVVRYFGDSGRLGNGNSAYAVDDYEYSWLSDQYDTARIAHLIGVDASLDSSYMWWLRSPGSDGYRAAVISGSGSVDVGGVTIRSRAVGIRPAMWITETP
jgi:hypothetical protein